MTANDTAYDEMGASLAQGSCTCIGKSYMCMDNLFTEQRLSIFFCRSRPVKIVRPYIKKTLGCIRKKIGQTFSAPEVSDESNSQTSASDFYEV